FSNQKLRAENQNELASILNDVFLQKPASYWLEECNKKGIPCAPINNFEEILNDPHVESMGILGDIKLPNEVRTKYIGFPVSLSNFDFEVYNPPPKIGEHNGEVLQDWGVF